MCCKTPNIHTLCAKPVGRSSVCLGLFLPVHVVLHKAAKGAERKLMAVQIDVKIQNLVTLGASVLNNNSASYASYAILLDQAIGHQVFYPILVQ